MIIRGQIYAGEAAATAIDIQDRSYGSRHFTRLLLLSAVLIAGVIAFLFAVAAIYLFRNGLMVTLLGTVGAGLGYFIGLRIIKRLPVARYRHQLVALGQPVEYKWQIDIEPQGLGYHYGRERKIAEWVGVTELFPSHGFWIFLVQGSPYFVPRRIFANAESEKAFLRSALGYMTEPARARSLAALKASAQ